MSVSVAYRAFNSCGWTESLTRMCVISRFPTTSPQVHPHIVTEFCADANENERRRWGPDSGWWPHPHNFIHMSQYPHVLSTNAATATHPDFDFRQSSQRVEDGGRVAIGVGEVVGVDGRVAMGVREVSVDWLVDRCEDHSNQPRPSPSADLPAAAADPSRRRFVRRPLWLWPIYSWALRTGSVGSHGAGIQPLVAFFCHLHGPESDPFTGAPSRRLAAPSGCTQFVYAIWTLIFS